MNRDDETTSSAKDPAIRQPHAAFTSVGAFCQRVFRVLVERVVLLMLRLRCLAKRKEALRGRNLSRDSQVEGAQRRIRPLMCLSRQRSFS